LFDLNGTFVIFILSFLVFMYLLNEIMLKPVGRVLELRAQKIQSDIDAGRSYRSQADETLSAYEKRLHDVRHQAQGIINEAIDSTSKVRAEQMKQIADQGNKNLEALRSQLEQEHAHLIDQVIPTEIALVDELTEKLLGEKPKLHLAPEQVKQVLQEMA
jgi:F-type H+-transporting ATPase subunit b